MFKKLKKFGAGLVQVAKSAGRKLRILAVGGAIAMAGAVAHADPTVDLSATGTAIKADLTAAQPHALAIFAIMFGVPLVISFFKRVAH